MSAPLNKHYKATGLIIGKRNFLEADKIIYIFSREKGILQTVVRGARRTKSKLSGITELFIYGDFEIVKGKKLDILISAKPLNYFDNATRTLETISDYFIISEVLQKLLPEAVPNPQIFSETLDVFGSLNEEKNRPYVTSLYIYKLIVLLGYGLRLDRCAACKRPVEAGENYFLSFGEGSLFCENCKKESDLLPVASEVIKLLKFIEANAFPRYSIISMPRATEEESLELISKYLDFIYQREFKARRFAKDLKSLSKNAGE